MNCQETASSQATKTIVLFFMACIVYEAWQRGGDLMYYTETRLTISVFLIAVTNWQLCSLHAHVKQNGMVICDVSIILSSVFPLSLKKTKTAFLLILSFGSVSPVLLTPVQGGRNESDLQNCVSRNWWVLLSFPSLAFYFNAIFYTEMTPTGYSYKHYFFLIFNLGCDALA